MDFSKDDFLIILQRYDDRYRDDLNKTNLFVDKIFDTYHREKNNGSNTKAKNGSQEIN